MPTLAEFFARLGTSAVDLGRIFVNDVVLLDPLSAASFLIGALLTFASVAVLGYLALGAVGDLLGVGTAR